MEKKELQIKEYFENGQKIQKFKINIPKYKVQVSFF